jgi:hypothetical protein
VQKIEEGTRMKAEKIRNTGNPISVIDLKKAITTSLSLQTVRLFRESGKE